MNLTHCNWFWVVTGAVAAVLAATAGCSGEGGFPFDDAAALGLQPDPPESAAIADREPATVAFADFGDTRLCTAIDENRDVHQFVVLHDEHGFGYLGEYQYTTSEGRITVEADAGGTITHIGLEDFYTGQTSQIALSWTDATGGTAKLVNSDGSEGTFDVDLSASPLFAKQARDDLRSPGHSAGLDRRSAAMTAAEEDMSLRVKVRLVDGAGYPVSELSPTFKLRREPYDGSAGPIIGVGMGVHRGDGNYTALVPAFRYERAGPDWVEWSPYFQSGVILLATASTVVGLAASAPVAIGAGVVGFFGTTILPGVVDGMMAGEYTNVPHPTAIGQEGLMFIDRLSVSMRAGDLKNTTARQTVYMDALFRTYVMPKQEFDLGTIVVEPFAPVMGDRYRLYLLEEVNQLEVWPEGSENQDLPLCQFAGGGTDCSVMATLTPVSEPFASAGEAVLSICGDIANLAIWPLGVGPVAEVDGTNRYLSWEVYNYLATCSP